MPIVEARGAAGVETPGIPGKFAEPSMDLWRGDFWVSDEPLKCFYRLLDEDFNLGLYFDPASINSLDNAKQVISRVPFIYSIINKKTANPQMINVGVAGLLKYERLRCGWHLFVSMENKFKKLTGAEAALREFYRRSVRLYFNHFTERYAYMEFLEEYKMEIETVEGLGGKYTGEGILFHRGKEIPTAMYRIARESIIG